MGNALDLDFEWQPARVGLAEVYAVPRRGRAVPRGPALPALIGRDTGRPYRLEQRDEPVYQALANLGPAETLERDPTPLVAFAERWGFLWPDLEHFSLARGDWQPNTARTVPGVFGQRVEPWIWAVRELRDALELWRDVEARDRKALRERVQIQERMGQPEAFYLGASVHELCPGCGKPVVPRDSRPATACAHCHQVLPGDPEKKVFEPIRTDRRDAFRVGIGERDDLLVASRRVLLHMVETRLGTAPLGLKLEQRAPSGVALVARSRCLLDAAWVQLASHVLAGDVVRRCAASGCSQLFVVKSKPGPERRFHNKACKQRDYRERDATRARSRVRKGRA